MHVFTCKDEEEQKVSVKNIDRENAHYNNVWIDVAVWFLGSNRPSNPFYMNEEHRMHVACCCCCCVNIKTISGNEQYGFTLFYLSKAFLKSIKNSKKSGFTSFVTWKALLCWNTLSAWLSFYLHLLLCFIFSFQGAQYANVALCVRLYITVRNLR